MFSMAKFTFVIYIYIFFFINLSLDERGHVTKKKFLTIKKLIFEHF